MKQNNKGFVSLVVMLVSALILVAVIILWLQLWQNQSSSNQTEDLTEPGKTPIEQAEDLKKQNDELQEKREEEYNSIYNSP